MKKKLNIIANILGGILIVVGLAIIIYGSNVRSTNAAVQASPAFTPENSASPAIEDKQVIQGNPAELSIPSVGIRNKVIKGVFDENSGEWTLTLDKVQYAAQTYKPNDKAGLTFMYGHNRKSVFSRLPGVKEGDMAIVKTKNGHTFRYRFKNSRVTDPTDVSIFSYEGKPILVLQTCTGLFYQDRQLFTFELVGVDDA